MMDDSQNQEIDPTEAEGTTIKVEEAALDQPSNDTVTIRGVVSTTYLRAGDTVTVTLTDHVLDLIARGYVKEA